MRKNAVRCGAVAYIFTGIGPKINESDIYWQKLQNCLDWWWVKLAKMAGTNCNVTKLKTNDTFGIDTGR